MPTSFQEAFLRATRIRRGTQWAWRFLLFLGFLGLFSGIIANEKPLYCKIDGKAYYPILKAGLNTLGIGKPYALNVDDWKKQDYDQAIFPLVPYSANTIDLANSNFKSPIKAQRISHWRFRHWLGTDKFGRDVLAGLIHGARSALLVGLGSMTIAFFLGIVLGGIGGYFGDHALTVQWHHLLVFSMALGLGFFWAFPARAYAIETGVFGREFMKGLGIWFLVISAGVGINRFLPMRSARINLPADLLLMRGIEIFNSIHPILLIFAITAVIDKPSVWHIIAIIGVVRWPRVARFIRAELLRIRALSYVESARALGLSEWKILFRHALPNAMGPVIIVVSFGVASAILIEATLSFLGIGLALDAVTWGTLLFGARDQISAWWLAIFPGLAIFLTVISFNLLGESLSDVLQPRRRQKLEKP